MSTNAPDQNQEPRPTETNLADEFREFGRQLDALLHTVRESPKAREIEGQVTRAIRDLEQQMNETLTTVRDRAKTQDLAGTLKGAATTAADEAARGMARGLHTLNEHMARTVRESEEKRRTGGTGGTPS